MVHVREPEPPEFALLDELISNLTASDEERLGLCRFFVLSPTSSVLMNWKIAMTIQITGPQTKVLLPSLVCEPPHYVDLTVCTKYPRTLPDLLNSGVR